MRTSSKRDRCRNRKGMSYILALIMVALLSSISMAMIEASGIDLRKAINQRESLKARLAAESGIACLSQVLGNFQVSGTPAGQDLLDSVATYLQSALPGGTVSIGGGQIHISNLGIDEASGSFSGALCLNADDGVALAVTGQSNQARREVEVQFELAPGGGGIFSKGIVAGGPIQLTGNARVVGANSSSEAELLTLSGQDVVYDLCGNARIEGDIYASNADGQVDLSGNVSIGGVSARDEAVYDHIHFGMEETEIPRPDPTVFEPFATTTLSGSTRGNRTFTNIRLLGVIYVESPNRVKFSGNVNVRGVIVTEDAGSGTYDANKLQFSGNMSFQGVDTLPNTPEFSTLRDMAGSAILAPGFGVKFTGNFGTVGGTLAAEKFTFTGNAGASVKGAILSYGDEPYRMTGNAYITIDRSEYDEVPPGFSVPSTLSMVATTYVEY